MSGQRYIFKTAKRPWQQQQAWSEVIASAIGRSIGVDVPRNHPARGADGTFGVASEFFFGFPVGWAPTRLVHGAEFMTRIMKDKRRGRPHTIIANLRLCRALRLADAVEWWARLLTFDALIGNTDRHPENWGVLFEGDKPGCFAPAFDNGTSLGYEVPEDQLESMLQPQRLAAYLRRGKHHCGWDQREPDAQPFIALCQRFAAAYPEARRAMTGILTLQSITLDDILRSCETIAETVRFTAERARFLTALVLTRQSELRKALGD